MPVLAGGHWTCLLLRRKTNASGAAASTGQGGPLQESVPAGCPKCLGTGYLECDPVEASLYSKRKDLERDLFQPALWPVLEEGKWEVKYYDPLPVPSKISREAASCILQTFAALGWPQEAPPVEPGLRQKDCVSCGLFVLHWVEQELREFRGEGPPLSLLMGGSASLPSRDGSRLCRARPRQQRRMEPRQQAKDPRQQRRMEPRQQAKDHWAS